MAKAGIMGAGKLGNSVGVITGIKMGMSYFVVNQQ